MNRLLLLLAFKHEMHVVVVVVVFFFSKYEWNIRSGNGIEGENKKQE